MRHALRSAALAVLALATVSVTTTAQPTQRPAGPAPTVRDIVYATTDSASRAGHLLDLYLPPTPTGKIVFSRSTQTPTSTPRSRSLWLLDVGTGQVRALTTATDSVYDMSVTWSPDGSNLVFERGVDRVREGQRHTLQVISTTTNTRPHALIHGIGQFSKPAYGPGNRIAFVSLNSSGQCVSVVDITGRNRRDLEEIPAEAREKLKLVWVDEVDEALANALSGTDAEVAA
jgi:Tol biopolymer transport system component